MEYYKPKNVLFLKYAEEKFQVLNKYKVFITEEEVLDAYNKPDKKKIEKEYTYYEKEKLKVVSKKIEGVEKIITFFPIK